ncbi:class I adenylate-forming enzyme family protein [Natrinema sp. 1APR25-10V2]|uniref:class I adenylate-forming enzyme family protein n=1 Tax=Natrinema sp. 1APR25-10V2 TaxID=2951081 RepID=UPI0028753B1C|nr:class I adenylate-forming enzyme family protein [Natrinema sp. 1APR25-10V2]MDS0478644.1 acyl--CoA ligase [Natrinema sp. 1APR25-10V2]
MELDIVPAETLLEAPYDGNVAHLLERAVAEQPDELAIEHAGETITYREFGDRVGRFADGLRELGLEAGDRVGLYMPNGIPFCTAVWACCHAGIIASPLNPEYRRREIEYQLEHADAKAVLVEGEPDDYVVEAVADLETEIVSATPGGDYRSLPDLGAADADPDVVDREDDDVLLQPYTSGTTGKPKGVLLTHRNFRVQIAQSVSSYSAGPIEGDGIIVLPMYHITGMLGMMASLCGGRTLHLLRPDQWDPELVLEKLDEHDIPTFVGVAAMFVDLLDAYDPDEYDLSTLIKAGQGGDKLPKPTQEQFEEAFDVPLSEGYGLTETTATSHTIRWSSLGNRPGSVGQPVGHTRSKVVDEEGNELGAGEEGEILIAGPQVMKGYYENPAANEEVFTDDGFFRTGDIGMRDEDNYYYIKGREKEMILTAGYNVYPREVENLLYEHPDIHEAAVFGLPDERRGETVAAAITPKDGAELTEDDVEEYVLGELAPYKHPRVVEIRRELPKTGSGKIRKTELQDEFVEEHGMES